MILSHVSRVFGVRLPIHDNDLIVVLDNAVSCRPVAELEGELLLQIIQHHLTGLALQATLAQRKPLALVPFSAAQREAHARARRARKS
jgi:hypothetical protein